MDDSGASGKGYVCTYIYEAYKKDNPHRCGNEKKEMILRSVYEERYWFCLSF